MIMQDFHAKVFAECFTTALMLDPQPEVEEYNLSKVNEYKISITHALAKMKNMPVLLFVRKNSQRLLIDLHRIFMSPLVGGLTGKVLREGNRHGGQTAVPFLRL